MAERVPGFDIARALAIFGMVIVNFKVVMVSQQGNGLLTWLAGLLEGRASALFVVLAGVGITFLTNKARCTKDRNSIRAARKNLVRRGFLLIAIGLAFTPIWPADILHFYGFYFLVAAFIFEVSNKYLLILCAVVISLFPILLLLFDYEKGWDWSSLTYHGFWTMDGMIRHILFNGFHPVVPWCAFLIFGMWLGRLDLSNPASQRRMLGWSLGAWITTEFTFFAVRWSLGLLESGSNSNPEINSLLSTAIIPPMPQYLIASGSLATVVIILCVQLSEKYSDVRITRWLTLTGKQALTLYVAHVIIGMGVLEALGLLENRTIEFALLSATAFFSLGMVYSVWWPKHFSAGPLEWLFRKLTNRAFS